MDKIATPGVPGETEGLSRDGPPPLSPETAEQFMHRFRQAVREEVGDLMVRQPRLLRIAEVASLLDVSQRTVETLIAEGRLRPVRIRPGLRRVSVAQLDEFIRECARGRGGQR